ncbi:MAG: efflux RND transporter permease subunit [Spirulinaceae cyanobacterium]
MAKSSWRQRLNISRLAIKYSWLTVCFWLAVTVAGLFAFSSLKYALFPDITFPVVAINATLPSQTALDTEKELTIPIEKQLQSLPGLDDIRSSSYPGQAAITVSFDVGTNLESSTTEVETALEKAELPKKATFQVIPLNLNESPVISYAIKSEETKLEELIDVAEAEIIPPLAKLAGVLRVDFLGTATTPKTDSVTQNQSTLVRFNGEDALAFQVIKKGNANTLEVVNRVEKEVKKLQKDLPEIQLVLAATQADYIQEATQSTIEALVLAIVLAVLVIFVFLRNWRATLITALAIPLSLLGTFIVMAVAGFNLETITLLALALVIGIIVDDAIVEVENIIRHIEEGQTPQEAALTATREIGLTVSASTITIVAVFLPVALMGGTVGQFFKPFGLTVSAAVITSLLIARTLSPVLGVYWLRRKQGVGSGEQISPSTGFNLNRYYRNLLSWSLCHRSIVIGLAIVSFIAGVALIPLIPKGFIPKLDRGEFNVTYIAPLPQLDSREVSEGENIANQNREDNAANLSPEEGMKLLLTDSLKTAKKLETEILANPNVASVFTISGDRGEPNRGKLYVKLKGNRQLNTSQVQKQLRADLPTLKGVTTSVEDIQFVELASTKPLQVALLGDKVQTLQSKATELKKRLQKLPGFEDITATGDEEETASKGIRERLNGKQVAYLSANLGEGLALGDATEKVVAIADNILPANITLDLKGDAGVSNHVLTSFAGTLTLSVASMLGVLLLLFGRLLEPLVVGLSLPLAIVGAMLALLITQSDFGMISLIGLIFLLGLLDKNALLLMDYANQLRKAGLDRTEAILQTGVIRLRPILMTTASTILGMMPIAFGLGAGAELRQPMAVAIIGGLFTSTLLSLIVVPVLYSLLEDWWLKITNIGLKSRKTNRF